MLFGEQVRLRGAERDDIPTFVRWFNDPEVRQYLGFFAPVSIAQEERWFETLPAWDDTRSYFFVIERKDGENWQSIGTVALAEIDWRSRVAELAIAVGEKQLWGQGYGTEAAKILLRFAFEELNLHRVQLDTFDFNPRAIRSYEKVGFQREGIRRKAFFRDGRYHDVHVMGILRDEFVPDVKA
jgi:RimJ/RimL family protein N-acetyltransferase